VERSKWWSSKWWRSGLLRMSVAIFVVSWEQLYFCLRQARDCCHLSSSKCHTSCYLRLWIKLFCCFLKVFWV
jgi:hypothetical protein